MHIQTYNLQAMLLRVKRWKTKAKAEKANAPKNKMNISEHRLGQIKAKLENTSSPNNCIHW